MLFVRCNCSGCLFGTSGRSLPIFVCCNEDLCVLQRRQDMCTGSDRGGRESSCSWQRYNCAIGKCRRMTPDGQQADRCYMRHSHSIQEWLCTLHLSCSNSPSWPSRSRCRVSVETHMYTKGYIVPLRYHSKALARQHAARQHASEHAAERHRTDDACMHLSGTHTNTTSHKSLQRHADERHLAKQRAAARFAEEACMHCCKGNLAAATAQK